MSRLPVTSDTSEVISPASIHALCNRQVIFYIITVCMLTIDEALYLTDEDDVVTNNRVWRSRPRDDSTISIFLRQASSKQKPKYADLDSEGKILLKQFSHLVVTRGVLYRRVQVDEGEQFQLVLPITYRSTVMNGAHNYVGHPGRDRTLSILKDRFYWPKISTDVEQWISKCDRCIKWKSPTDIRAPMVIRIDLHGLSNFRDVQRWVSVHLSCNGPLHKICSRHAYQLRTAKTTATAFFTEFVVHYGLPKRIHSDQGANFESELFKHLCQMTGMVKSRTSPYRPSGNGICERFNRSLLGMLGTLDPEQKVDWKSHIGSSVHAYNCTRHDSTDYAPYYLMFGRKPRLALDLISQILV